MINNELDTDIKNLIDNATKLIEEHKQTKTQLEMHIAFNKQLLGELEKLDNENKRLNNIIEQTQKILYIKLMNENKEKIYIQEVIDIIENLKGSDKE